MSKAKRPQRSAKLEKGLTFDQIREADDCPLEPFSVPEWDGLIYLQPMSCERMVSTANFINKKQKDASNEEYVQFLCEMCGECIVDEAGAKVFNGKEIEFLAGKNFGVVQRIGARILAMHGLTGEGMEEKKSG